MRRRDPGVNSRSVLRGASQRVVIAALVGAICAAVAVSAAAGRQQASGGLPYKVVGKIGKEGTGPGQFSANVSGLASDSAGTIYVTDTNNLRIQAFSSKGAYKSKYAFASGEPVYDVAAGPTGDVWGTTQVGAQVRRFPKGGGAPENLSTPKSAEGIAVDADGNVYVSTNGDTTHAIVRFDK